MTNEKHSCGLHSEMKPILVYVRDSCSVDDDVMMTKG